MTETLTHKILMIAASSLPSLWGIFLGFKGHLLKNQSNPLKNLNGQQQLKYPRKGSMKFEMFVLVKALNIGKRPPGSIPLLNSVSLIAP